MLKKGLPVSALVWLALAIAGLGGGACGTEPVPSTPTFRADVLPIMQARCIRCHGAGGTLNADPLYLGTPPLNMGKQPTNGFFDQIDPPSNCTVTNVNNVITVCRGPTCVAGGGPVACNGLGTYASSNGAALFLFVPSTMPPAPAPDLTDRELEVLKRWTSTGATP